MVYRDPKGEPTISLRRLAIVRRGVGILDARVVQGGQPLAQCFLDDVQFGQRQAALLELPVEQVLHQQIVNELAQATGRGRSQSEIGSAYSIGEHDVADLAFTDSNHPSGWALDPHPNAVSRLPESQALTPSSRCAIEVARHA